MNTTKGCLLDSSNCSQANAFFDSWRKVLSFFFTPPLETLCSVWNYTSSLLFFSIFHFFDTNFGQRPSSEKTIQGLLHLIYIINRYTYDPLSKENKTNTETIQARWQRHLKAVSRSPHPTKAWLPRVLWNAQFSYCLIML